MKKITFILLALITGTALGQEGDASADATAQVNALIVQPIEIKVEDNMNFGSIVSDGTIGTVVLNAASITDADASSTASLVASARNSALFLVKAAETYKYSITLPESVKLTNAASNVMRIQDFTSSIDLSSAVGTGVDQSLYVGGTLNVGANQPPGAYTGEVTVSVAYE